MPCFTAMRAEIALMSGSAFAVTHHAFSSGAGRTSDGNGSHASTLKSPSYTKSVSWQHYPFRLPCLSLNILISEGIFAD
ncbi:putative integrase [Shigella flexneri K-315]|uniref:Putative integrase n=1 Tax=Shigella flexneri K-315 TaxID=766150 RepID=I6CPN0_SHIFL|nr:putative integrase [Shigella flexneri K-315]